MGNNTGFIKDMARSMGFDYCGIAKAAMLDDDARRLERWLKAGFQGTMSYMDNHFDLRIDPSKLFPGAKSVITLLLNYYPEQHQRPDTPQIAKYAYGRDYHDVIRVKLKTLLQRIKEQVGNVNGRGFVDSAPVLERAWAVKSGLGWIGKNGNLLTRDMGSFVFIATLIVDLELEYDDSFAKDYCGSCRKCVDACPTDAILEDKVIDGSKCISYFTIELKEALIPGEMKDKFANWMFGCDTCQDVCPWNRFATPSTEADFTPIPGVLNLSTSDWEMITEDGFAKAFAGSPLKRAKFAGIKRNLKFLKS